MITRKVVRVCAAESGGISITTIGAVRLELEDSTLVRILTDWDLGSSDLSAIFLNDTKRPVRAFAKYLVTALRDA
jgi:hypothetical protein